MYAFSSLTGFQPEIKTWLIDWLIDNLAIQCEEAGNDWAVTSREISYSMIASAFVSTVTRVQVTFTTYRQVFHLQLNTDKIKPCQGRRCWVSWRLAVLTPGKYMAGQSMWWPPKMSHSFIQHCCWTTLQVSFTSWRMKDLRQKWKVKLTLRGAYTDCQEPGIVESLKTTDVGCNVK